MIALLVPPMAPKCSHASLQEAAECPYRCYSSDSGRALEIKPGESIEHVIAEAVNSPFKPPIYFGVSNTQSATYHRSDAEWKRDTFPQETQ